MLSQGIGIPCRHSQSCLQGGQVRPLFLRRMIDLLHAMHRPPHCRAPIRLNAGFRSDLAWWRAFVERWNGVSFLPPPSYLPSVEFTSDASGSWGCGAWYKHSWFQLQWGPASCGLLIAEKELIPIILAGAIWGSTLAGPPSTQPL